MQKFKRVTQKDKPSMSCGRLGEDYQRKQKVRAVIVSATVLGIPGRSTHTGTILYVESLEQRKS